MSIEIEEKEKLKSIYLLLIDSYKKKQKGFYGALSYYFKDDFMNLKPTIFVENFFVQCEKFDIDISFINKKTMITGIQQFSRIRVNKQKNSINNLKNKL